MRLWSTLPTEATFLGHFFFLNTFLCVLVRMLTILVDMMGVDIFHNLEKVIFNQSNFNHCFYKNKVQSLLLLVWIHG